MTTTQRYEKVVQEDLNVGTGTGWVTAPGSGKLLSTQVGIHSVARGQKAYTATWAPGAIGAGVSEDTTVVVPDAAVGDLVIASHDKMLTSDLRISGNVASSGVAQVVIHNPTAASVTVASGTVSVLAFPLNPSISAVTYTNRLVVVPGRYAWGAAASPGMDGHGVGETDFRSDSRRTLAAIIEWLTGKSTGANILILGEDPIVTHTEYGTEFRAALTALVSNAVMHDTSDKVRLRSRR